MRFRLSPSSYHFLKVVKSSLPHSTPTMAKILFLFAKIISLIPEQADTHQHTQLQIHWDSQQYKNALHQYSWFIKLSNNWHKVQSLDFFVTLLVLSPSWASSFTLLISRTLINATEPNKKKFALGTQRK